MTQQATDPNALASHLWQLAMSGDQEAAMLYLERMDGGELTVLSADLLARLYVRTGRFSEAYVLWQRILMADPSYLPARKALGKLDSYWLPAAVAKKFSQWFGIGVLVLFALYGAGMMVFGHQDPAHSLLGMATVLSVAGVFLAGLFAWAYIAAESLFGIAPTRYTSASARAQSPTDSNR